MSTEGYIKYPYIEPRLKREQKQVDMYIKKLKITLPQEEFVLKCLLSQEWNRRIIISSIEEIKYVSEMVQFKFSLTAPSMSVIYSCSNPYKEEGWSKGMESFESRANSVMNTFQGYCSKY